MGRTKVVNSHDDQIKLKPAIDPDAREKQLISVAVNKVEERMREGTASSAEYVHFLKLASQRQKDEMELKKLEYETELVKAKTEKIRAEQKSEEAYSKVFNALMRYSGRSDIYEEDDDEEL